jgi:hypothetical protein
VEQVSDQGIATHASRAKLCTGQSFRQASRIADFNPIVVDLDENIRARLEVVSVHDSVGNRLSKCPHRILGHFLAAQFFDAIGSSRVALDKPKALLDVAYQAAGKVFAVQNISFVRTLCQQAGYVSLRKKAAHILGEEEHPSVSEDKSPSSTLSRVNVHQHVFDPPFMADMTFSNPRIVFFAVEILRIAEFWADG